MRGSMIIKSQKRFVVLFFIRNFASSQDEGHATDISGNEALCFDLVVRNLRNFKL